MKKFVTKIKEIFSDKKKRRLASLIVIMPFLIVMLICGINLYKQAKNIIGLASAEQAQPTDTKNLIKDGSFVLRENATELQETYFAELKDMYENPNSEMTDDDKAISTVKNFVADFYTWSNKLGQYDVGGTYYFYSPQRSTIYIQVRDQFYKYINQHINKYGAEALLEVENVEASLTKKNFTFAIEENEYDAYMVKADWTYVLKEGGFDTSKYDTKGYFVVINNDGRFEIAYMGNNEYEETVAEE